MQVLTEPNGKTSYARVMGTALFTGYIICALWYVLVLKQPFPDIPPMLSGTGLLMYGINKFSPEKKV